jgi:hypothetical protein
MEGEMSRISGGGAIVQEDAIRDRTQLSVAATAFGLSAAVSILFNTALACVKDAYPPVFRFMAALTGHHWITQGLADLILFLVLGFALMLAGVRMNGNGLAAIVAAAAVIAGGALALWTVLF